MTLATQAALAVPQISWPADRKNWCWALVTAAVVRHYAVMGAKIARANILPCEVVEKVLPGAAGCCGIPWSADQPYQLETALGAYGHLAALPSLASPTPQEAIAELSAGRPLGVGLRWAGQNPGEVGHFALLIAADLTLDRYTVWDPRDGLISDSLRRLALGYPGGGVWESTYFTRP